MIEFKTGFILLNVVCGKSPKFPYFQIHEVSPYNPFPKKGVYVLVMRARDLVIPRLFLTAKLMRGVAD